MANQALSEPRLRILLLLLGAILALCASLTTVSVHAATDGWVPTLLYQAQSPIQDPSVIADPSGRVHVLWVTPSGQPSPGASPSEALEYAVRVNGTWTRPVSVYAAPTIKAPTAAVDQFGVIHVTWQEGNGRLYAMAAPVVSAASPAAWTKPEPIDDGNPSGDEVSDGTRDLYRVYAGSGSQGVFFQRSSDGGQIWSFPTTVSPAGPNASANFARVAVGPDGVIHVVWTEFQLPNGWPPAGLFYSHSLDRGNTWSPPIQMAGPGFNQANVAAGPGGVVHVAWNGQSGVTGRYDRWSTDNGKTWSAPAILFVPLAQLSDPGGSVGPPSLVIDSSGVFHVLIGEGNRVWQSAWKNGKWDALDYVPSGDESGLPAVTQEIPTKVRHIEQPVMTISQRHELVVVFWDERPGHNRLWAVTKLLDTKATPAQAFAVPTPTQTPPPAPTPTAVDPIARSASGIPTRPPNAMDARAMTLLYLGPLFGFLVALAAVRVWRMKRL